MGRNATTLEAPAFGLRNKILLIVGVICLAGLLWHFNRRTDGHTADQEGYGALLACKKIIKDRFLDPLTFGTPTVLRSQDAYVVRISVRPTEASNDSALHWFECTAGMGGDGVVEARTLRELQITNRVIRW